MAGYLIQTVAYDTQLSVNKRDAALSSSSLLECVLQSPAKRAQLVQLCGNHAQIDFTRSTVQLLAREGIQTFTLCFTFRITRINGALPVEGDHVDLAVLERVCESVKDQARRVLELINNAR